MWYIVVYHLGVELFFVLTYLTKIPYQHYVLNTDNAQNASRNNGKSPQNNEMAL